MRHTGKPIEKKAVKTVKKKAAVSSKAKISKRIKQQIERELDHLVLSPHVNVGKGKIDQTWVKAFFREFKAKRAAGVP